MKIMVSAYLDNNIGDDLMIKLLLNHFNKHDFYLYSNKTVIQNTFKNINNIHFKDPSRIVKDIDEMDVFLSIGGSIFNDLNSYRGQLVRLKKIRSLKKAKRKKMKIATLGCNLGPYRDKRGILLTKIELQQNDLVTVRDKYSYNLIRYMKSISNYYLADDIVYNYNFKKQHMVENRNGLGISVYRSLKDNENNIKVYKSLANISDNYIERTGKKVKLFAFDSEKENDLTAAHHVINFVKRKEMIDIVPYLGQESDFIDSINECELFISIRFHSAILADHLNIPFLPIAYSNKMESFLRDRGFDGKWYSLEELSETNESEVVDILLNKHDLFYNIEKQQNADKHFEEFERLLEEDTK